MQRVFADSIIFAFETGYKCVDQCSESRSPQRVSEPEPDIAVLKPSEDLYRARHPKPEDVLLIIEVADTTMLKDRNLKVPLYARTGILEVWLVNLPKENIEVYCSVSEGKYRRCQKFKRGEVVKSPTIKGLNLKVNEILG
jgi:Uma2 family endonuclease